MSGRRSCPRIRGARAIGGLAPSADPGGSGRELALVLPGLGPPPAEVSRSALVAAVAAVLERMAGRGRLAVFLDDLQWADDATLDLLPALAGALSDGPVALIGCYRSDELPRDHRLRTARAELRRARQLTEIDLAPLPGPCVPAILAALLGAEPEPELVSAVAGRADGIPFVVRGLAAALRLGGHLDYREGTVGLAGTGDAVIPEGIREAVLLRAAQLGPDAALVLDAAAVAGDEFDVEPRTRGGGLPGMAGAAGVLRPGVGGQRRPGGVPPRADPERCLRRRPLVAAARAAPGDRRPAVRRARAAGADRRASPRRARPGRGAHRPGRGGGGRLRGPRLPGCGPRAAHGPGPVAARRRRCRAAGGGGSAGALRGDVR